MKIYPLILSGEYTQSINGEEMSGHRTILLGAYSDAEKADTALKNLEQITYPSGWGISATGVDRPVNLDEKPSFD